MSRMIAGCGYLGERVAHLWHQAGKRVVAVTRSPRRASEFREHGWDPMVADIAQTGLTDAAPGVETLLFAVGYDRTATYNRSQLHPAGLAALLRRLPDLTKLIYISTTGVYGGTEGEWLDENSATQPDRESSVASLEAECVAANWTNVPAGTTDRTATSLRMGGLYGPGRIPHLAKLRASEPLTVSPAGFLNLVHIDDAASIAAAFADQENPPAILNVTDGTPVLRGEYYAEIARQIGVGSPIYAPVDDATRASQRGFANRRVSNARLEQTLPIRWLYPDYRAGIAHAIRHEGPSNRD